MNAVKSVLLPAAMIATVFAISPASADWLRFRGPNGSGISDSTAPTEFGENKNLKWKVELPGRGISSPIVVGDKVFVTSYTGYGGDLGSNIEDLKRHLICVDRASGKIAWKKTVDATMPEDEWRPPGVTTHGYASNTPVSDGEHLFVFLGKGGVYALDFDGNVKWNTIVGEMSSNRKWGSAASPLVYENLVIVNASEEARAIIALDKATGKEVWKHDSRSLELAYGTPRLVELKDGTKEIVISAPSQIWAMDPATGKTNWSAKTAMTGNVSPSVIVDGETVYSFGGYRSAGSVSVRAGGKDDVSNSNVNWTSRTSSYVATPLLYEDAFYWLDDRGLANSSSAKDGKEIYRERVNGLTGRPVYASPILIDGKIYAVTRRAGTIVYEPGEKFTEIARNKFAGDNTDFNASPAISENRLYLRSNKALYCVGDK
jgi:outer membrane protein assembly factor BamB